MRERCAYKTRLTDLHLRDQRKPLRMRGDGCDVSLNTMERYDGTAQQCRASECRETAMRKSKVVLVALLEGEGDDE